LRIVRRGREYGLTVLAGIGESQAKAVHQPDSVRELHLAGRAGRAREPDAECVLQWRNGRCGTGR
jgi:hypothetical protein